MINFALDFIYYYRVSRKIFLFPLYLLSLEARNLFEEQFMLFAERI